MANSWSVSTLPRAGRERQARGRAADRGDEDEQRRLTVVRLPKLYSDPCSCRSWSGAVPLVRLRLYREGSGAMIDIAPRATASGAPLASTRRGPRKCLRRSLISMSKRVLRICPRRSDRGARSLLGTPCFLISAYAPECLGALAPQFPPHQRALPIARAARSEQLGKSLPRMEQLSRWFPWD
jgi:hypothetical protein